jgi:hypothetical protein
MDTDLSPKNPTTPTDPLEAQNWSARIMSRARYEYSVCSCVAGFLFLAFGDKFGPIGYPLVLYGLSTMGGLIARRWDR